MEAYKNDYTKREDEILWELHEIRNKLSDDFEKKTLDEINQNALKKIREWKEKRKNIKVS